MVELIVLFVICVGLCRRRGEPWEFSRARLADAVDRAWRLGEHLVGRVAGSLPFLLRQCAADVRSLLDDLTGVVHPRARRQLREGARSWIDRSAPRSRGPTGSVGVLSGAAGALADGRLADPGRAVPARGYATLQRAYLDGAISIDEYVVEADRLRRDEAP